MMAVPFVLYMVCREFARWFLGGAVVGVAIAVLARKRHDSH